MCITKHEQDHASKGSCPDSQNECATALSMILESEQPASECAATKVEIDCYKSLRKTCGDGENGKKYREIITHFLRDAKKYADRFGSCIPK